MFSNSYFAARYFANNYFNNGGDGEPPEPTEGPYDPYWTDVVGGRMIGG